MRDSVNNLPHKISDTTLASVAGQTYTYDGTGRRVKATGGTERRFLVAPTPESDLESPQLVADNANAPKQLYVFVGDDPLLRFDSTTGSNSRVYYLEDGMGSVIGLATHTSPGTGNTSRLFYDGFGNVRTTAGPTLTSPTGTGGDFRFHGLWLEDASGLYHARARDYDPKTGRFLSRDRFEGTQKAVESLLPYAFANNNPQIYFDPSGAFSLIEVNFTSAQQFAGQSLRAAGAHAVKQRVRRQVTKFITVQFKEQLKGLVPNFQLPFPEPRKAGTDFGNALRDHLRELICTELAIPEGIFAEVPMTVAGDPLDNGFSCNDAVDDKVTAFYATLQVPRPDFILSGKPKKFGNRYPKAWTVGDFKGTTGTFYRDYIKPGYKKDQMTAIQNYARKHTYSRTSLYIVLKEERGIRNAMPKTAAEVRALKNGSLALVAVIFD